MPILTNVSVTKHALRRANERLYQGINISTIKDLLEGKYVETYTNGIKKRKDEISYHYVYGGCRWILTKNAKGGYTLVTLYWETE